VELSTQPITQVDFDTVIFGSGLALEDASTGTVDFVRRSFNQSRRVAGVCMGAFVLAQAGILDGRQVTTHWATARELQARYPSIRVDADRIFIVDGSIWTSAGASAAVDLALGMIENDLGVEIARLVAKKLVLYHRRGGGRSQHSALLDMDAKSDRIQRTLEFAKRNLDRPLGVDALAEAARLSPRQFSRAFRAETGRTAAKAVENLRLEAARVMIEQTSHPIDVIAVETGFSDRERMRQAFLRAFGQPPQAMRRLAHAA
jgi:transcriptional regulator GlxA family with amidase domain